MISNLIFVQFVRLGIPGVMVLKSSIDRFKFFLSAHLHENDDLVENVNSQRFVIWAVRRSVGESVSARSIIS